MAKNRQGGRGGGGVKDQGSISRTFLEQFFLVRILQNLGFFSCWHLVQDHQDQSQADEDLHSEGSSSVQENEIGTEENQL